MLAVLLHGVHLADREGNVFGIPRPPLGLQKPLFRRGVVAPGLAGRWLRGSFGHEEPTLLASVRSPIPQRRIAGSLVDFQIGLAVEDLMQAGFVQGDHVIVLSRRQVYLLHSVSGGTGTPTLVPLPLKETNVLNRTRNSSILAPLELRSWDSHLECSSVSHSLLLGNQSGKLM